MCCSQFIACQILWILILWWRRAEGTVCLTSKEWTMCLFLLPGEWGWSFDWLLCFSSEYCQWQRDRSLITDIKHLFLLTVYRVLACLNILILHRAFGSASKTHERVSRWYMPEPVTDAVEIPQTNLCVTFNCHLFSLL